MLSVQLTCHVHLHQPQRSCCYLHNRLIDLSGKSYWTPAADFGPQGKRHFFAQGDLTALERRLRALRAYSDDDKVRLVNEGREVDTTSVGSHGIKQDASFRGSTVDKRLHASLQAALMDSYAITHPARV